MPKRTVSIRAEQVKNSVGATNWSKLKQRTDAELESAAAADPDARPFSTLELRGFKPVTAKPGRKTSK